MTAYFFLFIYSLIVCVFDKREIPNISYSKLDYQQQQSNYLSKYYYSIGMIKSSQDHVLLIVNYQPSMMETLSSWR